jgi:hypothetical protein
MGVLAFDVFYGVLLHEIRTMENQENVIDYFLLILFRE